MSAASYVEGEMRASGRESTVKGEEACFGLPSSCLQSAGTETRFSKEHLRQRCTPLRSVVDVVLLSCDCACQWGAFHLHIIDAMLLY